MACNIYLRRPRALPLEPRWPRALPLEPAGGNDFPQTPSVGYANLKQNYMTRIKHYSLAGIFLLLLWQASSRTLGEALLPPPLGVLDFFARALVDASFWSHVWASFLRVSLALALAWCIAFPLGLLLGYSRKTDRIISPLVFLTYPIPKIVLLPVFLTVFGLGDAPRIVLVAMTTGYQILVVTRDSALGLDPKYLDSFRSLGGSQIQMLRHVLVPATLPDAVTALRVASGTAVAVLFMVESFATSSGLGFLIMDAWGRGDMMEMYAGILAMSIMGVALYEVCNFMEHRLCRWREARRA